MLLGWDASRGCCWRLAWNSAQRQPFCVLFAVFFGVWVLFCFLLLQDVVGFFEGGDFSTFSVFVLYCVLLFQEGGGGGGVGGGECCRITPRQEHYYRTD